MPLYEVDAPFWKGTAESNGWIKRLPKVPVIRDRQDYLVNRVRGLSVIHVGYADAGAKELIEEQGRWIHRQMADTADQIIGLDADEAAVSQARLEGFSGHIVDCTDSQALMSLGLDPPDVIVLGEVIEHVGDAQALLSALCQIAGPSTTLILTTPNAYRLASFISAATSLETVHPDHVAVWTMPTLCELMDRSGWRPTRIGTYQTPPAAAIDAGGNPKLRRSLSATVRRVSSMVVTRFPYWADGLIVEAQPCALHPTNGTPDD